MENILQTTDPIVLSFAQSVLQTNGIQAHILDRHISILEGSIGIFAQRLCVACEDSSRARRLLLKNGLEKYLRE